MSTSDSSTSPPGALIVPDLVRLDVPVGPDKKDVIEYLADVVASALASAAAVFLRAIFDAHCGKTFIKN